MHCRHDVSNHVIIGILQDGKFFLFGDNSATSAAPLPLQIQETPEEERKEIFKTKPRSSIGNKRKITTDADEPRRWSGARNPVPASKPTNVVAKLIAMKRDDEVPQTIFDHTELGADYFVNLELTTAKNFTSTLKMISTLGENFSKKWYLYTRLTNKSLKSTQY